MGERKWWFFHSLPSSQYLNTKPKEVWYLFKHWWFFFTEVSRSQVDSISTPFLLCKCKPAHTIVTSYWYFQICWRLDMLSLSTLSKELNSLQCNWLTYIVSITTEWTSLTTNSIVWLFNLNNIVVNFDLNFMAIVYSYIEIIYFISYNNYISIK